MQKIKSPPKRLSELARRLDGEWSRLSLPRAGEVVIVAVSGGADSTALLLTLDELCRARRLDLNLLVAHLDHGLRKASKEDADWVTKLSHKLGLQAYVRRTDVGQKAKRKLENLEQAARSTRYEFFAELAASSGANLVLAAHTMDDQAETVLMRLLRGSGAEGLSGMEPIRPLTSDSEIRLVRPFLGWARRSDTDQYCRSRRIRSRVDEMNEDSRFLRVRVRKQLLPLMETFNNKAVETLCRTAALLRDDAAALSTYAGQLLQKASETEPISQNIALNTSILAHSHPAVRRRVLRQWIASRMGHLRRVEMVHLLAVEQLLEGNRGRAIELPNGVLVTRRRGRLYLSVKKVEKQSRNL
jgi:tRNA(Ile)-lysidine synthase